MLDVFDVTTQPNIIDRMSGLNASWSFSNWNFLTLHERCANTMLALNAIITVLGNCLFINRPFPSAIHLNELFRGNLGGSADLPKKPVAEHLQS